MNDEKMKRRRRKKKKEKRREEDKISFVRTYYYIRRMRNRGREGKVSIVFVCLLDEYKNHHEDY